MFMELLETFPLQPRGILGPDVFIHTVSLSSLASNVQCYKQVDKADPATELDIVNSNAPWGREMQAPSISIAAQER